MTTLFNLFDGKSKEEAMALVGGYYEVEETVAEIDRLQQTLKNKIEILANNNSVPKSLIKEVMENKMSAFTNISYEDILVANREETSEVPAEINPDLNTNFKVVSDTHFNHKKVFNSTGVADILAQKKALGLVSWNKATPEFLYLALKPVLHKMSKLNSNEFQKARMGNIEEFAGLPFYRSILAVFGGWSKFADFVIKQQKKNSKPQPTRVVPNLGRVRTVHWSASALTDLAKELKSEPKSLIANGKFSIPSCLIISEIEAKTYFNNVAAKASSKKPNHLPWASVLTPKQILSLVALAIDKLETTKHKQLFSTDLEGFRIPSLTFFVKTFGGWKDMLKLICITSNVNDQLNESQSVSVTKPNLPVDNIKASHPFSTEVVKPSVNPNNVTGPAFLAYFENGLNLLTDLNDEDAYINNLMDSKLMETVSFPSLNVIESNYADFSDALNAYYLNKFKGFEFNSETGSQLVEEFIKLGKPKNKKEFNKAFFSNGNSKKFVPLNVILTSLSTYDFYFNYVTSCIAEW